MTIFIVNDIIILRKRNKGVENLQKKLLMLEIKNHGFTLEDFSKKIGIDYTTFYRKINGVSDFTRGEIQSICKILDLSNDKLYKIFFA